MFCLLSFDKHNFIIVENTISCLKNILKLTLKILMNKYFIFIHYLFIDDRTYWKLTVDVRYNLFDAWTTFDISSTSSSSSKEKHEPTNFEKRDKWASNNEFLLSSFGYAIGIGVLWRFPYICMRNGGGAFLIPYLILLLVGGIPLFTLEMCLGQFSGKSPATVWCFCPIAIGTGMTMVILSAICVAYYNAIMAYSLFFLYETFNKILPWSNCNHMYNTYDCIDRMELKKLKTNIIGMLGNECQYNNQLDNSNALINLKEYCSNPSNISAVLNHNTSNYNLLMNNSIRGIGKTASDEFFHQRILQISSGIYDFSGFSYGLLICLSIAWIICILALIKGVKTSGKVAWITATSPFIFIMVLMIRGLTLEGSSTGARKYLVPEWSHILKPSVWLEAGTQIFFTLGPGWGGLITLSSYNDFTVNIIRYSIMIPIVITLTAFCCGLALFSTLGHISFMTGLPIEQVATKGPALAFVVFPEAIATLPFPHIWAVLFFLTVLTLGIDSQFGMLETVLSAIFDRWPKLRRLKALVTTLVGCGFFCIALLFVTKAGMYWYTLIDWYVAAFMAFIICIIECVAVCWIYGADRFLDDIALMFNGKFRYRFIWKLLWKFIIPVILFIILLGNLIVSTEPYYGDFRYPKSAIIFGWFVGSSPALVILILGYIKVRQCSGKTFKQKLYNSLRPTAEWLPNKNRLRHWYRNEYPIRNVD
ncbi:hypothetical protein SNEBB_005426 [Seison nebaliae]|nr:hypothetical protein SNEBB_005426 [Seison nebaliae]